MSRWRDVGRFAVQLYAVRASTQWHARVLRSPMARLLVRPGSVDPYPVYDRIRDAGALVPTPYGNWASARHDVCSRVLRDRRFGVQLPDGTGEDGAELSFLELDPPDHTRLRRLAAPAFGAARVAGYRPLVERTVARILDEALVLGRFDLVDTVGAALPVAVIADLLGIPASETGPLTRHGAVIGSALDGVRSLAHARALLRSNQELAAMFERVFALRRQDPGVDVISTLLQVEGSAVEPAELVPMCTLLLVAGFETTVNLIGNGTLALLAHRDQWDRLRADPALAPVAVEEMLRYDSPVQRTSRVAHEDVELDGLLVRRGQLVITLLGGANRDPEAFPDPGRFDLTRPSGRDHLSFSGGIHYCLGAPLARMEAEVLFEAMARRLPDLRTTGRLVRRRGRTIRGPRHLPVAVR